METVSQLWYENLPDGMHDVLVGPQGGLFLAGFDSLRRVCLVMFAPPFGQPLRTVTELPYRDYGRYTPTVLAARDPKRDNMLYVLLYQHPDNLGIEQTSLYRIDPASGDRTLLSATSSPFWVPVAMLPRQDGSVLVALNGAGKLLRYDACNDTACEPAQPVLSSASNATGKAGLTEVRGRLCLVTGSSAVLGTGGRILCERPDGSLQTLALLPPPSPPPPPAAAAAAAATDTAAAATAATARVATARDAGRRSRWRLLEEPPANRSGAGPSTAAARRPQRQSHAGQQQLMLRNPSTLVRGASGFLYVVSHEIANEFGYQRGSVHLFEPRPSDPSPGGDDRPDDLCWHPPRLVIDGVSNPRGVAIDADSDKLYVVEQSSLRGYNYETFHGDVLVFCARGQYECAAAQNSGECSCRPGLSGNCCDVPLGDHTMWFSGWMGSVQANAAWWGALVPVVVAAAALLVLGQRRRRRQSSATPGRGRGGLAELSVPLRDSFAGCHGAGGYGGGGGGGGGGAGAPRALRSLRDSLLSSCDSSCEEAMDYPAHCDSCNSCNSSRSGRSQGSHRSGGARGSAESGAGGSGLARTTSVHDALTLFSDTCGALSPSSSSSPDGYAPPPARAKKGPSSWPTSLDAADGDGGGGGGGGAAFCASAAAVGSTGAAAEAAAGSAAVGGGGDAESYAVVFDSLRQEDLDSPGVEGSFDMFDFTRSRNASETIQQPPVDLDESY